MTAAVLAEHLAGFCIAGLLALASGVAIAAEAGPRYNTVELQAEAQREVPNDLLGAALFAELTEADPAALASSLNKAVQDALRVAREYKGVQARSGGYQTYPVYARGGALQGWRGRAEIRLESRDFEAGARLIGKLQAAMQLGGIQFSVSPEARRTAEDELIPEAITAFRQRAGLVAKSLAGKSYKLQRLNVAIGQGVPPQPRLAMARQATPEVTPPALEAGLTRITVTASGAVEVLE